MSLQEKPYHHERKLSVESKLEETLIDSLLEDLEADLSDNQTKNTTVYINTPESAHPPETINKSTNESSKKEVDIGVNSWAIKIICAIVAVAGTAFFNSEIIEKPKAFREAVSQVNSNNYNSRNTEISTLEKIFKDCKPITLNTLVTDPVSAARALFINPNKKQWEIVKTLANSIHTNYKAPKHLDISEKYLKDNKKYHVESDLQNAINIIAGVKLENIDEPDKIITLNESNFYKAQLEKAQLPNVDFNRSYLYLANLTDADLTNAHLNGAYLRAATLTNADLTDADLENADLHSAVLKGAKFTRNQIIKSCYWSRATYDEEKWQELPPIDSDKSIKNPECNKMFARGQKLKKHSLKNNKANRKTASNKLSFSKSNKYYKSVKNNSKKIK